MKTKFYSDKIPILYNLHGNQKETNINLNYKKETKKLKIK
jgi:hypothetical protein